MESRNLDPSKGFLNIISDIQQRVKSLETKPAGSITVRESITTTDPITGVDTVFGQLPDGTFGVQEWVNDVTPPEKPSTPLISSATGIFTLSWDGLDSSGLDQPKDYFRTSVEISVDGLSNWKEIDFLRGKGTCTIAGEPYAEVRHFRLVSYDQNRNASVPSNIVSLENTSSFDDSELLERLDTIAAEAADASAAASSANGAASAAQSAADAAAGSALEAAGIANGKGKVIFSSSAPAVEDRNISNLWIDTTGGTNIPKRWVSGTTWTPVTDKTATDAAAAAAAANTAILTKTTTFYGTSATGTTAGDLWIDTTLINGVAGNVLKRWSGSAWVTVQDKKLQDALTAAGNAQSTADSKVVTYAQTTEPTGMLAKDVGDIWLDTDDGNKMYRYSGSAWVAVQDKSIAAAASLADTANSAASEANRAAIEAAGIANTKGKVVYGTTAPIGNDANAFTLWIDTTGGKNTPKRWTSGTTWVVVTDKVATDAATAAANAQSKADSAFDAAGLAATAAGNALTAANGKNRTWNQDDAPAGTGHKEGDIWFDTNDGNKLYLWKGSPTNAWAAFQDAAIGLAQSAANAASSAASAADSKAAAAQGAAGSASAAALAAQGTADTAKANALAADGKAAQALADALAANNLAVSKGKVLYQSTAPTGADANAQTLWIDTTSNLNTPKRWTTGTTWVAVSDKVATDAAALAATKGKILYQNTAPTGTDANLLTLWIDTTNNANTPKKWVSGTTWTSLTDKVASDAAALAATKGKVLFQTSAPTGADASALTLWIDTTGGANTPKRWVSGTTWAAITDKAALDAATAAANAASAASAAQGTANTAVTNAATAQTKADQAYSQAVSAATAAGNAQGSADGKNTNWYQDDAPAGVAHRPGDLWFDTNDGNKPYVWKGAPTNAWTSARDASIAAAQTKADTAFTTANGKTTTYYQNDQPSGGTYIKGDMWVDTDGGYKISTYTGSVWQTTQDALSAKSEAITAAATDATSKASTAKTEAINAAATAAQAKADQAKADAIAAAATAAQSKADAAQAAAIAASATDAATKATAAQTAAAADAKAKADQAKADAISAAATTAQTKADAALAAAKTDATSKANQALTDAKADAKTKADAAQAAAILAAKADAKSQAEAAEARAATTAAADAKTKADAAQAAALAAAKAYADTEASGAGADALAAAKADATAKADAAKAAAIAAAALDATAKKEQAEANAAADAKIKADKALADAKVDATTKANAARDAAKTAAALDATTKADAAKLVAINAQAAADKAQANALAAAGLAGSKGKVWFQPTAPSAGTAHFWTGLKDSSPSVCTVDGVEFRRNLSKEPSPVSQYQHSNEWEWTQRWFGSGSSGTVSVPMDISDGPVPWISSYLRKKWTAVTASADVSFSISQGDVPVASGDIYSISFWVRASWDFEATGGNYVNDITLEFRNSAKVKVSNHRTTRFQNIPIGEWYRYSTTFTIPEGISFIGNAFHNFYAGKLPAIGDTIDGTGLLVEKIGTVGSYFDGSTPDEREFDLWIDTDDGNKPYRWDRATKAWAEATDQQVIAAAEAAAAADGKAAQAQTDASKAIGDAAAAKSIADKATADILAIPAKIETAKQAAIDAAALVSEAKASAAQTAAMTAAATDAKNKADAAQAAAIAAAKTASDLAASGAQQAAITAAKADATTKADAAREAAKTAASADATSKANQAKTDAITSAANDATTKANNAQAAAITAAAADAATKAGQAKTDAIASATTMTNGIGKNLSSTAVPTTSNLAPQGSVWRRTDASGRIIGTWEQTASGVAGTWTPRLITSEVIDNLDVGKLSSSSATIDSAVINKLSAGVATVIELNADRITGGTIAAGRLDAAIVRAKLIDADAINAVDIIAQNSITATNGIIASLDAGKISVGTLNAARIGAKSIGADKVLISSTDNLINEADFKANGASWEIPANFVINQTAGRKSLPAMVVTNTATLQTSYNAVGAPTKVAIEYPSDGGNAYRVSAWVKSTVAVPVSGAYISARFTLSTGGPTIVNAPYLNPTTGVAATMPTPGTWYEITGVVVAPANTISVAFAINSAAALSTGTIAWDMVSATRASNGELIVDGTVTANHMKVGTITGASGILSELNAGVITTGSMSGERITARTISVDTLMVGSLDNVLTEPEFNSGLRGWGGTNATTVVDATGARNGGTALKITANSTKQVVYNVPGFSVEEKSVYRVSAWIKSSIALPADRVKLYFKTTNTAKITAEIAVPLASNATLAANTWVKITGVYEIPTGVVLSTVGISSESAMTSGNLWVDNISCVRAADGNLIVDGSIDGKTVVGATIKTSNNVDRGILLNSDYLRAWNSSGVQMFNLDAITGAITASNVSLDGSLSSKGITESGASITATVGATAVASTAGTTMVPGFGFNYTDVPGLGAGMYFDEDLKYGSSIILTPGGQAAGTGGGSTLKLSQVRGVSLDSWGDIGITSRASVQVKASNGLVYISPVADPVEDRDAAPKYYVDEVRPRNWLNIPAASGWAGQSTDLPKAKIINGVVYLTGKFQRTGGNTTAGNNSGSALLVGNLPLEYRPSSQQAFICLAVWGSNGGNSFCRVEIQPDGRILMFGIAVQSAFTAFSVNTNITFLFLSTITYPVA